MHKFKLFTLLVFLFYALLILPSCESTSTNNDNNNLDEANQLAMAGFELLNQKAQEIGDKNLDSLTTGEDLFSETDYNTIKSLFETALDKDEDNPMAHLGMAILELFSINYDSDIWDLINDIDAEFSEQRVLNNQLVFLGSVPKVLLKYTGKAATSPEDALSFARVQNLIENNVLPKLENAISHLDFAVELADSDAILLDVGDETVEIDPGEIFLFRGSLYATKAGFKMLMLYDVDLFDSNGGYDWLDDIQEDDNYSYGYDEYRVELTNEQRYLYLITYYDSEQSVHNDSLLASIVKYNLQQRPSFMKFRKSGLAPEIKDDILSLIDDLENSVTYIENETDDQSNDLIKFEYIQDANTELGSIPEDAPDFMQQWTDIHDVIDWLHGLFTETYTFTANQTTFEVDLGRMFDPGLEDLRDFLPYHSWNIESEWKVVELEYSYTMYNYGYSYYFYLKDQFDGINIENVDYVVYENYDRYIEPIVFLNANGGDEIDLDQERPYFPDYTMNGIFPDMSRDKFLILTAD